MVFLKEARVYRFLLGRFFDVVSSGMIMMALPWLMLQQGGSGTLVALVALLCTLASFIATPIFATLIDRHSRKAILQWVQLLQAMTALILCLLSQAGDISLFWMSLAQLLFWVSNDLGWNASNALVQENFDAHEYPKVSSYKEVIGQAVLISAGAAGIVLLELWDLATFALFAAVASGLGWLCYSTMPYRRRLRKVANDRFFSQLLASKQIVQKDGRLMVFFALSCLSYPAITYLIKLVPIYLMEFGYAGHWFALWKTVQGSGALVCGVVVVWLLGRFKETTLMIYATFTIASLLAIMGIFLSPVVLVATTLIFGFCTTLNRIARINVMNLTVDVDERGRVDGALVLFSTLAQSLSYVLIALLAHFHLVEYGFIVLALIMALAGMAMRQLNPNRDATTEAATHH